MQVDPAEVYRAEISKYEPLSEEVEERLIRVIRRSQNGEAKRMVARHKLQLVFSVARTYQNLVGGTDFIDIVEQGNLGLFKAIDEFDPDEFTDTEVTFTEYATAWIRQAIEMKYFGVY